MHNEFSLQAISILSQCTCISLQHYKMKKEICRFQSSYLKYDIMDNRVNKLFDYALFSAKFNIL